MVRRFRRGFCSLLCAVCCALSAASFGLAEEPPAVHPRTKDFSAGAHSQCHPFFRNRKARLPQSEQRVTSKVNKKEEEKL
jgi:hypothetical protein